MTDTTSTLAALPAERVTLRAAARGRVLDWLVVALACSVFLFIALLQLELPGLYTDEAFDVIPSMQMVLGHHVELQGNVLDLGGLRLPLMSSSAYQGVTYTYLAVPFFLIGGVNVFSLRTMTVLVGALGVLLAYFLAKSWFGRPAAALTALLLAVSPSWIFYSRLGVYVVSVVMPIATGALLAFTQWVRARPLGRRNGSLYLGMFLLGLGLTTKLLFLWSIVAMVVTAVILWGRPVWENRRIWWGEMGHWARTSLFGLLAFCLGALPFLLYNVLTRGTYYLIRETVTRPGGVTTHGVSNSAILRNLWTEADAFKVLVDGGYFWFQGAGAVPHWNLLTPTLFAISALGLVAFALLDHRAARAGRPVQVGAAFAGVAVLLAALLALAGVGGALLFGLTLVALLLALASVLVIVVVALRDAATVAASGRWLLGMTTVSGAAWWFGGAGRPEGPAPDTPLGLWPIDALGLLFWLFALVLVVLLGVDRRPAPYQRPLVAALAITGLIVAQSAVTVSGLWSTHLLIVLPLPQMIIAAFALSAGTRLTAMAQQTGGRVRVALRVLPAVVLAGAMILLDVGVDYAYHRDLQATGGGSTFSDAIYRLVDYLERKAYDRPVVAMDWGFRRPIQFLTHEQIDPAEVYGLSETPPPEFFTTLDRLLQDPQTLYLFHTADGTAYPRLQPFLDEVQRLGKHAEPIKTLYHRDGPPVYEVYEVK